MVNQTVSTMLNGAAVERMEEIGATGYDQATVDNESISSWTDLAFVDDGFGPGNDPIAEDDIDDFHTAVDTLYRTIGTHSLAFVVTSTVSYASESNPDEETSARTKFKKVTVEAVSVELPNLGSVTLSRSFSCGSACAW